MTPSTEPPARPRPAKSGEFLNPYNFVAAPDRDLSGPLGDRTPDSHDRYHDERFTGRIPITLTTRTPLLLPDQAAATPASTTAPRTVGTRRRGTTDDAPPLLTGSTVKGVLRSAYEAITNSRYGVVSDQHTRPVVVRQQVENRRVSPAVVTQVGEAGTPILVDALRRLYHTDAPAIDPDPAPWIPYKLGAELAAALGLDDIEDLDCQQVDAWIHLQDHPVFPTWRVTDIAPVGDLPARATMLDRRQRLAPIKVRGHIHWTHSTFPAVTDREKNKKRHERLVVTDILAGPAKPKVSEDLDITAAATTFAEIIDSYVRAHEHETGLNRYGSYVWDPARWQLRPGRTLYVEFDGASRRIISLTPAVIGRVPYPVTPLEMILPAHQRPTVPADLSPADRVFGWTHAEAGTDGDTGTTTAYRGNLRIDPPEFLAGPDRAIHDQPVWLATLNSPKTQQTRFYTGGSGKPSGYSADGALRGRKFYLPHPDTYGDTDYWTPTAGTRDREYIAPAREKPQLRFAVRSWVPAGATFTTTVWVQNLTRTELAALLWLLALPADAVHGMGLGKPLGFGSVRIDLDWESVRLHTYADLRHRYTHLTGDTPALTVQQAQELVTEYDTLLDQPEWRRIRDQFLDAVTGFTGTPVQYPRTAQPDGSPAPRTEQHYEWFVENAKPAHCRDLPELGRPSAPTLPYLPKTRRR